MKQKEETMRTETKDWHQTPQSLAIFIDYHNLEGSLRNEGAQMDILVLRDYLAEGRDLIESFVFVGTNPNNVEEDERFHRFLRRNGFVVKTKKAKVRPDGSLKCDFDVEMVLDVVDFVTHARPNIVCLVTGDGDFQPLTEFLRMRGIRVEVASTPTSISHNLLESANGYINLLEAIREIGAPQEEHHEEEVKEDGQSDT